MAYPNIEDINFTEKINAKKEFAVYRNTHKYAEKLIGQINDLTDEILNSQNLQYYSYQMFAKNYLNMDTPYKRLLMKHSTGSGKTIGAIAIALNFIKYYRQEEMYSSKENIGSVFFVSFEGPRKAIQSDLIKFPQFGFVSREEINKIEQLKEKAHSNMQDDINKLYEFVNKLKKRFTSRNGNGFFDFVGYRSLVNRLFKLSGGTKKQQNINELSADDITKGLNDGSIEYDKDYLKSFENSLIICDEIHNVYNSLEKNNWGVTLQFILDNTPSSRAVFMSATPINNKPTEIVDLLNLLLPKSEKMLKADLFEKESIKPTAYKLIEKACVGRISFLIDNNPVLFPSVSFSGEPIKGIPYIKFIRCKMGKKHEELYNTVFNKDEETIPPDDKYIVDYIIPGPNDEWFFRSADLKKIEMTDGKWNAKHDIHFTDGAIRGSFLEKDKMLREVSEKYFQMVDQLHKIIADHKGKTMIYHNMVTASGVIFISEILANNGIIDIDAPANPNTLCVLCGGEYAAHSGGKKGSCEFKPAKFILLHGLMDKMIINKLIDKFNNPSNAQGHDIMVLIGSRIMKESYDLKAIQNLFVMSRPDNISMLIQIIGRAVRKNSHIYLPKSNRHVNVFLFVHSSKSKATYEEIKYKEKVAEYNIIKKIESIINKCAVDSYINEEIIAKSGQSIFQPEKPILPKMVIKKYDDTTFRAYRSQDEIDIIKYIIKRAFLEISRVWIWEDLHSFVLNPPFSVEYDTTLIDELNVVIALSSMLASNVSMVSTHENMVDHLFDSNSKIISFDGVRNMVIKQVGKYYILSDIDSNNNGIVYVDSPYRIYRQNKHHYLNIAEYLKTGTISSNFEERKISFKAKYENTPIGDMLDIICDYGMDFHTKFLEEIISYIFGIVYSYNDINNEYHSFYLKMLYYYDLLGVLIFADTLRAGIYNVYRKYTSKSKNTKSAEFSAAEDEKNNNLNLLKREMERTKCETCIITQDMIKIDDQKIKGKEYDTFEKLVNMLPVGYYIYQMPRFYHPDKGWFEDKSYMKAEKKWVENNIIIGYNVKSDNSIRIKFKIRKPIGKIEYHKDTRLIEKGSSCSSKSKSFLKDLCKKLKIELAENVKSIQDVCSKIKEKLIQLEYIERKKGTNLKYFYSHFEIQS